MRAGFIRRGLPAILCLGATGFGAPSLALDLVLPGRAVQTHQESRTGDRLAVPLDRWDTDHIPTHYIEGTIDLQSWRITGGGTSTLQALDALARQLGEAGYQTMLRCAGRDCGGFDFRFGLDVLPAPAMFVDLFDYRFLSARLGQGDTAPHATVLISTTGANTYAQITLVRPEGAEPLSIRASTTAPDPATTPTETATPETAPNPGTATPPTPSAPITGGAPGEITEQLMSQGHGILGDLEFATGSATLGPGPFASLSALAAYLKGDGARRIALVGHTDATGGLDVNISISRQRARAVLDRLAEGHGVPRAQLEADGVGYLAPIASNLTEAGRQANRRVEAVLLTTQ